MKPLLLFITASLVSGDYIPLDSISKAPGILPLECGIERETPMDTLMMPPIAHSNGLEYYWFDTNGDTQKDVVIAIPQGDENRYPLFYMFDRVPFDDEVDIVYIDDMRDGSCSGIRVYWTPKMDKESNRHENKPVDCVT